MSSYKIKSYAKVNLSLHVTGKSRKLHKIESIISFLKFNDSILINKIDKKNHDVSFVGKYSKGISKNNTVSKLLEILDSKRLLSDQKFKIKIVKKIPQKSGLGGGSMNAASLLNFFINKKIIKINKNYKILNITKKIGSDVILGIKPKNSILLANGKIHKYDNIKSFYILAVKPRIGCSTRYIYSKVKYFSKPKLNFPNKNMFRPSYLKKMDNALENIAFLKYPILKKIKDYMETLPGSVIVRMSGSGSTIIAYFYSKKACAYARNKLKKKFKSNWCIVSKTI